MPWRHKTQAAVNDLLGLSSGVSLLLDGVGLRLGQDELAGAMSEEQKERLDDLFLKLHQAADDVADFAREVAQDLKDVPPDKP